MKFRHKIFPDQRVIFVRYEGAFSLAELMASARTLWSDPRYSRDFDGIVDLASGSVRTSIEDLRALIDFLKEREETSAGKWAAVATSPLATAFALIYKRALARRHPFDVFSTWEGACEFLDVDLARDALD